MGVTGGIASGKTTMADLLAEMGAGTIDFDILAREVVQSGRPAWQDIVAFFGQEVLNLDRSINQIIESLNGKINQTSNQPQDGVN